MRRFSFLAALALVLAACTGAQTTDNSDTTNGSANTVTTSPPAEGTGSVPLGAFPEGPSALTDLGDPALPEPLVDATQIISGGPPPDGIPPIDEPTFETITEADETLEDNEPVVALDVEGDARAYPVKILIWHEIVNDTVGGVPVAITYCPLCNSAVTYERTVRGVETTFGTSGSLFASALVMYDRATESLWTHFDGKAVAGVLTGDRLDPIPSPLLSWGDFKTAHPEGQVLSSDTGFSRNYGQNPYQGYDNPDTAPFLFRGDADERARAKQRVVGVSIGDASSAFALEAISGGDAKATHAAVGDTDVVILWKKGQATALEAGQIADGRDVGSVGVFRPEVDGQVLSITAEGDHFVDAETASTWDITGTATAGELEGSSLEQMPHLDTFWFAWSTYQPGTALVEG